MIDPSPPIAWARGAQLRPRALGGGGLLLILLALGLSGCATKRDLKDLQAEIRILASRQDSAFARLAAVTLEGQDSLSSDQSEAMVQLRGEVNMRFLGIEEQLITLQELTGQSQRNIVALRDQFETRRDRLVAPPPVARDSAAGEVVGEEIAAPRAGGAAEIYSAAVTQFNRGSSSTARMAFTRFLTAYPNHPLASEAKFYLADILVQENRLDEAIEAFLEITELFPTAARAPFALYRIGVLYIELEDLDQARSYLQRVVNTYPDSGAALVARERLEEIS